MRSPEQLRNIVRENLPSMVAEVNRALKGGKDLTQFEVILKRLGRGGNLPTWYADLAAKKGLPNLDGKTLGSVIEMILVAVLEAKTLKAHLGTKKLSINPARGVDIPLLELGVKSPSTNFCTSEPFSSAYERIYGNEHDALILLTDYQDQKKTRDKFTVQIADAKYLEKEQIADANLCKILSKQRALLLSGEEARAQRIFRFVAHVNQSDWRAKQLLKLLGSIDSKTKVEEAIKVVTKDFKKQNGDRAKKNRLAIAQSELDQIMNVGNSDNLMVAFSDASENWIVENIGDQARLPTESEWKRLTTSKLAGEIGMSFALQWRYNFGQLFPAARGKKATPYVSEDGLDEGVFE